MKLQEGDTALLVTGTFVLEVKKESRNQFTGRSTDGRNLRFHRKAILTTIPACLNSLWASDYMREKVFREIVAVSKT
jgi:hypothetical protein